MSNKHKRWFHSSRVKFPFVNMSSSWFFGVNVFDLDLGVQIDSTSNNQSWATLWVLETCLFVWLLPFMIILITASLSSKIFNKASWREESTFEEIKLTLSRSSIFPWIFFRVWRCVRVSPVLDYSDTCFREELRLSDPTNQVRVYRPSSILHLEKWFLVLLNCAKLKFVSYTSNLLEQMYDFRNMHNVPPDVDFESSRSPAKSESWNSPNLPCLQCFQHDNIVCNHMYDECKRSIKRDNRLSHALVHFVIDGANLLTDHKISGFPTRAKYKHFRKFESILFKMFTRMSILFRNDGH